MNDLNDGGVGGPDEKDEMAPTPSEAEQGLVQSQPDPDRPNATDFLPPKEDDEVVKDEIYAQLRDLKERGKAINYSFRMPKRAQPVAALQKRLHDIRAGFIKKNNQPRPPPKKEPVKQQPPRQRHPKAGPKRQRHKPKEDEHMTQGVNPLTNTDMTWFHTAIYGGCALIGTGAEFAGVDELSDYGDNVWANKTVLNPVISEVAKELGIEGNVPIPAPVQLVMILAGTAAGTYLSKHPENPMTVPTMAALHGVLQLTFVTGAKGATQND